MHLYDMKEWILSVSSTIIITIIISLIAPQGRLGKYVKSIFALIMILVVVQPILSFDINNLSFDNIFNKNDIEIQTEYIDYIEGKKEEYKEEYCVFLLEKLKVKNARVDIIYDSDDYDKNHVKNVNIYLDKESFAQLDNHIDIIKEAKKTLSEYLQVNSDRLVFYE